MDWRIIGLFTTYTDIVGFVHQFIMDMTMNINCCFPQLIHSMRNMSQHKRGTIIITITLPIFYAPKMILKDFVLDLVMIANDQILAAIQTIEQRMQLGLIFATLET